MKSKIFHFFETAALIVAMFGILWGPGHLVFHDIPTAVRGYEEVAVEWEYEDDGSFRLIEYGYDAHQGDLVTQFPKGLV